MNPSLSYRAAHLAAQALAAAVTLLRPVATYTEEDDEGEEVTSRCIVVLPLVGASPWRLDLWREDSCVHARVLGHSIEVHYTSTAPAWS